MKKGLYLIMILYDCQSEIPKEINFDTGDYQFNSEIETLLTQTKDGEFGNYIKEAVNCGFRIIGYDEGS